jgi:hypothetical protein
MKSLSSQGGLQSGVERHPQLLQTSFSSPTSVVAGNDCDPNRYNLDLLTIDSAFQALVHVPILLATALDLVARLDAYQGAGEFSLKSEELTNR